MQTPAQELFSPDCQRIFAGWGIMPSELELGIHRALSSRTLKPDDNHLRAAAAWLHRLMAHHLAHSRYEGWTLAEVLGEKTALVLRMAYQHVPALAAELELPDSPLHAIEAAARFLPPYPPAPSRHLEALRQAVAAIDLPVETPAGADPTWHANRRRLQQLVLQDNPARFLSWPVVMNSMFMNNAGVAGPELAALQARADYAMRWLPALREDALGAPARTPLHVESSNNLIHHAYNLLQLELHAGIPVERLASILEFGGGYGSSARLAFRLGFRGQYVIFDLPEFSALQRFYLGSLGFPVEESGITNGCIRCLTALDDLRNTLPVPDLFLATWSLSETPVAFRDHILPFVMHARHVLVAYQERFGEADNVAHFADVARQLAPCMCKDYAIPHLPGNRYLVAHPML